LRYWNEHEEAYESKGMASYNQRSQYWHLQSLTCNKDFRCIITKSALDLKMAPKTRHRQEKTEKLKQEKHTNKRRKKNSPDHLRLVKP
jgi:hypothetical protein